ncbi:MAG: sensor histidine kinase [Anaerolineales bacterium]|nr:MAG: sensor histidine kinase [Anaerolineales bacterium]
MENLSASRRNVWEKWDWVWHASSLAFLGLHIVLSLGKDTPGYSISHFLILSAVLVMWYLPFIATTRERWCIAPRIGLLYFLPGWGLWAGLIALDGGSMLLAGMFYPLIFTRFPIHWAIPVAIAQTLGLYLLFILLYPTGNWFIILIITLGLLLAGALIGVFISSLINQSVERQRMLDEFIQTRARVLKMEREAGVLAERQRMAREIHDTLAQHFTSVIMHLAATRLSEPADLQTHVEQAEQTAREGLDEARRMIWDRKPEQLVEASLVEAIEEVAARWSVENAVHVDLAVTGTPQPLDPSMDHALLRISQEALHNIKKHARARNVTITLSYMTDALALDVADDGRGFDAGMNGRGFGLKSMLGRVEEIGGELTVESEPGVGTKVAVLVPIPGAT